MNKIPRNIAKYQKSLKEFGKKLEIFEDDLDKKYQAISLLKINNRNGIFYNLSQNLKLKLTYEVLEKSEEIGCSKKDLFNYFSSSFEEIITAIFVQYSSGNLLECQFFDNKILADIAQKNLASEKALFEKLHQKIQRFKMNHKLTSLLLDDAKKEIFLLYRQILREGFYFTRQCILDLEQQVNQSSFGFLDDAKKEKINTAKKFLKKLKEDQIFNEKNLEFDEITPIFYSKKVKIFRACELLKINSANLKNNVSNDDFFAKKFCKI